MKLKNIKLLFMIVLLAGCSKMSFSGPSTPTNAAASVPDTTAADPTPPVLPTAPTPPSQIVCGPNEVKITRPTRILFVVDQSGSNVDGPYEAPGQATDPHKVFRTQVMQQFYLTNQSKTNVSWGLNVFNNKTAQNLMTNSSGSVVPFSPLASDFNNSLSKFEARDDLGDTPYRAALKMIQQVIAKDLLTAPQYVYYLVAFMTDGYPTDYCPSPSQVTCPGQILESQINTDVQSIVNLANGAIQFSTIYYGKSDSDAAKRLQRMATIGLGEFVDTNKTLQVQLNDVLTVDQEVCVQK